METDVGRVLIGYFAFETSMLYFLKQEAPETFRKLRRRPLGRLIHLPGKRVLLAGYKIAQKIYGFN